MKKLNSLHASNIAKNPSLHKYNARFIDDTNPRLLTKQKVNFLFVDRIIYNFFLSTLRAPLINKLC